MSELGRQAGAVFRKELMTESRSRHGVVTAGLFTLVIAAALGYGAVIEKPTPTVAAAMTTAGLIFASALTVPRTYLIEDEQGTLDILRLRCDPSAAYLGKLAYALLVNGVAGSVFAMALVGFLGSEVVRPGLFVVALVGTILGTACAMAFVSSLVVGAANKWILAAALGVPLLLPQSILSVLALRHALGTAGARDAASSAVGLFGFAVAMAGVGVVLAPWLWGLAPVSEVEPKGDQSAGSAVGRVD